MTPMQSKVWKTAEAKKVTLEWRRFARNSDEAIRNQFTADSDKRGTRAWAIIMCIKLPNADLSIYTDEVCDSIISALN